MCIGIALTVGSGDRVLRVILIGELFPHNFRIFFAQFFNLPLFPDIFFAQFFNLPHFPDFFFKYVKFNELEIFASGEFHE